jgi:hypothetical protein
MAVKAKAGEEDLFALAAKAGSTEAQAGISNNRFLLGADGDPVGGLDDPGFETRVKPPADAKKATTSKSDGVKMPRGSAAEKTAADIADTLEDKFTVIFGMLAGIAPVTSVYGTENSPKAIKALMDIGKRRPTVMKALIKIADGADSMQLGTFAFGIVASLGVDFGRLQGDELLPRALGVTDILEKYFKNEEYENATNSTVTEQAIHGKRFAPVA